MKDTKGVCIVKMENGREVYHTKINYCRMKKAKRNVELIDEAPTIEELDKKLRRI